jgi:predicted RecB family nuclease
VNLCGENGPVYAYNAGFEKMVIRDLADRFPTYAAALETIIERVVDLHPIAKNRYYHPSQHGSWSLKVVLPTLCPELSYGSLDGVQDGSMAVSAYQEAIAPETTNERKAQIQSQLREYCKLDTFAMVRIWEMFRGV